MLCQHCNKENATVHFEQVVNNKKTEMYICEDCAKKLGVINMDMPFSVSDFFSDFLKTDLIGTSDVICDKCGMSYYEFQNTGKLGCDQCYKKFKTGLDPLLNRIQGSNRHIGKGPEEAQPDKMEELRGKLKEAVSEERYEDAAKIRDEIRGLKNE